MSIKMKINESISNIHYEIDSANDLKNKLNFDTEMGRILTVVTRLKILREFLKLFKQIKLLNRGDIENDILIKQHILVDNMPALTRRCKLHFYQLRRLEESNYEHNTIYFTLIIKLIYSFCLRQLN
jgi:hypothetical protein